MFEIFFSYNYIASPFHIQAYKSSLVNPNIAQTTQKLFKFSNKFPFFQKPLQPSINNLLHKNTKTKTQDYLLVKTHVVERTGSSGSMLAFRVHARIAGPYSQNF